MKVNAVSDIIKNSSFRYGASKEISHAQYIYLVQMDIPEELDGYFNRIYDIQHAPNIRKVPGVISCSRYALESSDLDGVARYIAIYFIESPDVPTSPDWAAASDAGGWAALIDHYITNRSHSVYRRLSG